MWVWVLQIKHTKFPTHPEGLRESRGSFSYSKDTRKWVALILLWTTRSERIPLVDFKPVENGNSSSWRFWQLLCGQCGSEELAGLGGHAHRAKSVWPGKSCRGNVGFGLGVPAGGTAQLCPLIKQDDINNQVPFVNNVFSLAQFVPRQSDRSGLYCLVKCCFHGLFYTGTLKSKLLSPKMKSLLFFKMWLECKQWNPPPHLFFFLFFVWDFSSCSFQQGDIKVNVECSCNWSAQQRKRAVPNCFQIYLNSDPSLQLQFLDQSQGEFGSFHLIRAFSFPSVWGLAMACKPSRRGTLILQHPAPVRPRVRGRKWAAVVLDKKTDNDKQGGF